MSDVIKNQSLTTLMGRADADSTVSVFDGNKLLGMATADNFGNWSLEANIKGNPVHNFTETLTDAAGNSVASAGVTVYSPNQHQTLVGGTGNDFLIAGQNDTLTGGTGNETFVFNANFGKDVVNNFNTNHDVLAFSDTPFANDTVAQVLSQTHDSSAGAVIAVDAHDSITLPGVTMAQLAAHPSDFSFFDPATTGLSSALAAPSTSNHVAQLVQAIAGFGASGGPGDSLNTVAPSADTSHQSFLTMPHQHT
jgi:hypothetical protein